MAEDIYRKRKEQEKTVNPVKENKNPEEAKLLEQKKAEFDSAMNELKEAIADMLNKTGGVLCRANLEKGKKNGASAPF